MKGTAGALIAATLRAYQVTHVFGMADPVHVFHALDRGAIQPVTVRDEKHGAIMAHGYAKATGRPGVCAATTGPGAIPTGDLGPATLPAQPGARTPQP